MKQKLAKVIRVITTPPIFAALLCTLLYFLLPGSFASGTHYLLGLIFLTAFPIAAYPLAAIIPVFRNKGRDGERTLALILSVGGYIGGFVTAMCFDGAAVEQVLFGTYLFSGITLAVCTLLHCKASGHTCGCSGPIALLAMFVSPWFLLGYPLLTPIVWASKKLGRHSMGQLVVGAIIPVVMLFFCRAEFLLR